MLCLSFRDPEILDNINVIFFWLIIRQVKVREITENVSISRKRVENTTKSALSLYYVEK